MEPPTGDDERAAFLPGNDERTTFLRQTPEEGRWQSAHYSWTAVLGAVAVSVVFLIGSAVYFASRSGGGGGFLPPRAVASVVQQASSNAAAPPFAQPWWLTHDVAPAGPERDMGSWTAVTFSEEQQGRFGVDENGTVTDKERFAKAVPELEGGIAAMPPWWVTYDVEAAGKDRAVGSWTAVTFSEEQQDLFGVDQDGVVTNATTFAAARAANFFGEGRAADSGEEEEEYCGGGPPENMACTLLVAFGEDATEGDMQEFASAHRWFHATVLRSLRLVVLRYDDDVDGCCSTYNESRRRKGVTSVEFDQMVHALDPNGGGESEEEHEGCGGGPPENMGCTLIVAFGDGATTDDVQQFADEYSQSAHSQMLRSLKQVILRYEDDADRCCSAYNKSWSAKGVVAVEFDQIVHALDPSGGAIGGGGGAGSVGGKAPAAASGEGEECAGGPPKEMGCTLIVVFREGVTAVDVQQFADRHNELAHPHVLRSLRMAILPYNDDVDRCCRAYNESWEARGVASVEFDQAVHALGAEGGAGGAGGGVMSIS